MKQIYIIIVGLLLFNIGNAQDARPTTKEEAIEVARKAADVEPASATATTKKKTLGKR